MYIFVMRPFYVHGWQPRVNAAVRASVCGLQGVDMQLPPTMPPSKRLAHIISRAPSLAPFTGSASGYKAQPVKKGSVELRALPLTMIAHAFRSFLRSVRSRNSQKVRRNVQSQASSSASAAPGPPVRKPPSDDSKLNALITAGTPQQVTCIALQIAAVIPISN